MNKFIVTTTINPPTEALRKFAAMDDWKLIVVGDKKTPHDTYKELNCIYLHPAYQENGFKELSDIIGWNCIQRRNIGFVEAYNRGADVIATVDDDNIPYDNWGSLLIGNPPVEAIEYVVKQTFDPLSVFNVPYWHRGFPVNELTSRTPLFYNTVMKTFDVQADLWDGDPDIDAFYRIEHGRLQVTLPVISPYCSTSISPFNSQNTFLTRKVIPYYTCLPGVGRMDDIWGGYILQQDCPCNIVYNTATVRQDRNVHNFMQDFELEANGYVQTPKLLADLPNYRKYLPDQAKQFLDIYRSYFKNV